MFIKMYVISPSLVYGLVNIAATQGLVSGQACYPPMIGYVNNKILIMQKICECFGIKL